MVDEWCLWVVEKSQGQTRRISCKDRKGAKKQGACEGNESKVERGLGECIKIGGYIEV